MLGRISNLLLVDAGYIKFIFVFSCILCISLFLSINAYDVQIDEGDGAFYGPKIDISVSDALNRKFQCATLQVCSVHFYMNYAFLCWNAELALNRSMLVVAA
jgi:hypothetical protein